MATGLEFTLLCPLICSLLLELIALLTLFTEPPAGNVGVDCAWGRSRLCQGRGGETPWKFFVQLTHPFTFAWPQQG